MIFRKVYGLQVKWDAPAPGTCTKTEARGMTAHQLADQLRLGLTERCGRLAIPELFVPQGFSGGGAYMDVPASAVISGASDNAPGNSQMSRDRCLFSDMAASLEPPFGCFGVGEPVWSRVSGPTRTPEHVHLLPLCKVVRSHFDRCLT
jgi:hypothetical protein